MKKIIILILGVSFFNSINSQDIIPFLDPCFSYPELGIMVSNPVYTQFPLDSLSKHILQLTNHPFSEDYCRHLNTKVNQIYGIAVTSGSPINDGTTIRLLDIDPADNCTEIASVANSHHLFCKQMYYDYIEDIVPCYIYLFNTSVSTPDTFYVGTAYSDQSARSEASFYSIMPHLGIFAYSRICNYERTSFWGEFGGFFPILELPCPRPWAPSVGVNMSGRVDFHWRAGDTALYQMAFYSYPDSSLVFETDTLTDTTFTLRDSIVPASMVDGRYMVRLRKACDYTASAFDTIVWSDWSEPRQFLYMHSTAGIDATDGQTPVFLLSPNPAKGIVTVEIDETQYAMGGAIQVVDMEGRVVLTKPWESAAAQPLTLDISGLAAGVYLVRLNTPMGTTTRKLVVE